MKKLFLIATVAMLMGTLSADAQKKKSVGTKVKNTAKDVGNQVAETASKGASKLTDQVYKGKTGPNGQTVYIDNKSKYYWVDDKGHHQYILADQLKDKPKN